MQLKAGLNKRATQNQSMSPGMGNNQLRRRAPARDLDEVMQSMEERRSAFLTMARKTAVKIAVSRLDRTVTVDDVRELCPPLEGLDPRLMGAIFRHKMFEPVGFENSTRRDCHYRPIRRFKLIEH